MLFFSPELRLVESAYSYIECMIPKRQMRHCNF